MAKVKLRELLVAADRGDLDRNGGDLTFADLAREWLDYIEHDRKRKRSTVFHYRAVVQNDLIERFGSVQADRLTTRMVDDYRKEMVSEGKAARTVNKRLLYVGAIYRLAAKRHDITKNPTDGVEHQPVDQGETAEGDIQVYSPEEIMTLARAAEGWHANLIVFAAFSGLRLGELRNLRWGDIDFEAKRIFVRKNFVLGEETTPKSKRMRTVPLIDQSRDALLAQRERSPFTDPEDLVFPNDVGTQFDDSNARKAYKRAIRKAKLKPIRFHDLRHTFGTLAVNVWPLHKVQGYMGHADIKTTMIYVHFQAQDDDVEALSAYVTKQLRKAIKPVKNRGENAA